MKLYLLVFIVFITFLISCSKSDADLVQTGIDKFSIGDYEGAIADYTSAIEANAKNENAFYNRGLVYLRLGKYSEAEADFAKALELKPDLAAAMVGLGNSKLNLGFADEAKNLFNKAIELDAQMASAIVGLGNIELVDYNNDAALALYNRALSIDPESVEPYLAIAKLQISDAEYDLAVQTLTKGLENIPNNFELMLNRGIANLFTYESPKYNDVDNLLEINPNLAYLHLLKSANEYNQGNYKSAIEFAMKTLEMDSNLDEAYFFMGLAKMDDGNILEGCNDVGKSSGSSFLNLEYHFSRNMGTGLGSACNPWQQLENGQIYYREKDYESALKSFDIAIALDPEYGEAYIYRGFVKADMGDVDGACKDFDKGRSLSEPEEVDGFSEYMNMLCNPDKDFVAFWNEFRNAVLAKDKKKIASFTNFQLSEDEYGWYFDTAVFEAIKNTAGGSIAENKDYGFSSGDGYIDKNSNEWIANPSTYFLSITEQDNADEEEDPGYTIMYYFAKIGGKYKLASIQMAG